MIPEAKPTAVDCGALLQRNSQSTLSAATGEQATELV
jgi:hypothetical protein